MESSKFKAIMAIMDIDEITVKQAERTFFAYKDKGVVLDGVFSDDKWFVCDEYAKYTLDFSIDENDFKELGAFLDVGVAEFKDWLKTYIISKMGVLVFTTLRNMLADIRKIIGCPVKDFDRVVPEASVMNIGLLLEFFSLVPSDNREKSLETLLGKLDFACEDFSMSCVSKQRSLASFDSYFKFNDILNQFWEESTDERQKLFYFPVWLWWNLSGVWPMRPREFVLTPRNCIEKIEDKYYLTVRKSNIKGSGRTKSYRISDDYKTERYEINEKLAKEILWYKEKTYGFVGNELNTLFTMDPHYDKWERSKCYRNRYFTYINLSTCLRYFFNEIVCGKYGYTLVFDNDKSGYLEDKEIHYLHLGDTRHISMINMIMEGATAIVVMELAGHNNPEMSSHYYSNIATLVECKTYRQYKKLIKGKQNYSLSNKFSPLNVSEFFRLSDGGRCYSKCAKNSDFSDCYKACGPAGEIGYCKSCTYYRAEGKAFTDSKEMYINRIRYECENLGKIVNKIRKYQGEEEEILQALMRIKDAGYSYQQYLMETEGE